MGQTEQSLRAAIFAEPHSDEAKLVYADWLEEQSDPRSELLRAMVAWDVQQSLKLSGITRRTHHHQMLEPVLLKLPDWRSYGVDCVERVLATCPEIPLASSVRAAVEFARDSAGGRLTSSARHALEHTRHMGLSADAYRLSHAALTMVECVEYQDVQNGMPMVLEVAVSAVSAIVEYHLERCRNVGEIDMVSSRVYDEERYWQLLRLCEYKMFDGPLTPVC